MIIPSHWFLIYKNTRNTSNDKRQAAKCNRQHLEQTPKAIYNLRLVRLQVEGPGGQDEQNGRG
jgi:hypothetical protein